MSLLAKLVCLAVGAFAIGTESYVVAGLLPDLATDLHVSVAMAGQLITVFALAYALGSPVSAVLTASIDRRRLLLGSIAAFALFNVVAACAHTYIALMLARVGLALTAGTFMPAASAYAVAVAPLERRGRALAIIYTGLTVATVIGVPLGVLAGEHFGWRFTFVGVAGLSLLALVGMIFALAPVTQDATVSLRERIAIARRPDILGALVLTVLVLTGAFSVYTYLAPYLQEIAGLSGNTVAGVLFLFGLGSAIGNLASGVASDRIGADRVIAIVLSALVLLFVALALAGFLLPVTIARWVVIPVVALWGVVGWSFPSAQQTRIVAMEPRLAPITLSLNASAIYVGVALGAFLGSIAVGRHAIPHLGLLGAACEVVGLGAFAWTTRRRRVRSGEAASVCVAASEVAA